MFDSAAAGVSYPKVTSIDENRYVSIPPNSKRIVSFQPIGSIWQSAFCWPLSHASLTWEGMLASSAAEICAGSTIPHATVVPALGAQARSQQFKILLPRFECSRITLSSVGQSDFDALISSKGLNHSLNSYVTLQAQVQGKDIRTSFSRSLANIKEIYVTLYRDPEQTTPTTTPSSIPGSRPSTRNATTSSGAWRKSCSAALPPTVAP